MSFRGRTLKKRGDDGGEPAPTAQEQQELQRNNFLNFLNTQSQDAYKRPWHRLEHGLRLNRLRLYADDEAARNGYNAEEKGRLLALLTKAHERKLLTSKNNVTYDAATEKVTEVKGLVMHRGADGSASFRILDKKPGGITVRRRAVASAAAKIEEPTA
jgi:hypothetical protein